MTQEMVNDSLSRPFGAVTEYTDMIGISEQTKIATRQYAEWSAAAGYRMFSVCGVKAKEMAKKELKKYCGRGMPWRTKIAKIGTFRASSTTPYEGCGVPRREKCEDCKDWDLPGVFNDTFRRFWRPQARKM